MHDGRRVGGPTRRRQRARVARHRRHQDDVRVVQRRAEVADGGHALLTRVQGGRGRQRVVAAAGGPAHGQRRRHDDGAPRALALVERRVAAHAHQVLAPAFVQRPAHLRVEEAVEHRHEDTLASARKKV